MHVCGIDVSTRAIDLVLIPLDDGPPIWHRYPLTGQDAWDRVRNIPDVMPRRNYAFWDSVLAVGIENPQARGPAAQNIATLHRAIGAVLSCIPRDKLVQPWQPSEWRKRAGLKGNCSKEDVYTFAIQRINEWHGTTHAWPLGVPNDATDAWCIAIATRNAIEQDTPA